MIIDALDHYSQIIPGVHEMLFTNFSTLAEQCAIANVIDENNLEIITIQKRLEKTRTLKQTMMQELLTDRTRST